MELSETRGLLVEVRGELKAGRRVVFMVNERPRPGQPVQIKSGAPDGGKR